jgi:hypothetical protein
MNAPMAHPSVIAMFRDAQYETFFAYPNRYYRVLQVPPSTRRTLDVKLGVLKVFIMKMNLPNVFLGEFCV